MSGRIKKSSKPLPWQHNPKYHSKSFLRLYKSLLNSPAWLALSNSAKWQYIVIYMQYTGRLEQVTPRGITVKCPYNEFKKYGISGKSTISRNSKQLEEFGFIKIKGGGLHVPNEYTFSDKWHSMSKEDIESINCKTD